jgi:hypothetical protein
MRLPAFFAKEVDGLQLRNLRVDWSAAIPQYFSDGVRVENFNDLTIDGFSGRQAQAESGAAISLLHGSGVSITNSRATNGTRVFLDLDSVQNRRVFVNYDVKNATKVIVPSSQRFDTEIGVPALTAKQAKPHHLVMPKPQASR